jgi:hypothetical protein
LALVFNGACQDVGHLISRADDVTEAAYELPGVLASHRDVVIADEPA